MRNIILGVDLYTRIWKGGFFTLYNRGYLIYWFELYTGKYYILYILLVALHQLYFHIKYYSEPIPLSIF